MPKIILLFLAGSFSALSMAPANFWPALFLGLATLYIFVTPTKTPKKAAVLSFSFSFGYFTFSLSWIGNALLIEDNPYWWAWPLAVTGIPFILALFASLFTALYKVTALRFIKQENSLPDFILFSSALAVADYARGHLFTGFPWNLYGYTWIDILPIAQVASLSNIYLLNTITIFWAMAIPFILLNPHKKLYTLLITASFILSYLYGLYHINEYKMLPTDKSVDIVIVQPNIKQSEKWKPEKRTENFLRLIEMSRYESSDLINSGDTTFIIWPETAIAQDVLDSQGAMEEIGTMLRSYPEEAFLITGALRREENDYYNSIITLNRNTEIIDTYDKGHLVPFGEYIPLDNIIKLAPIVGFTGFKKGKSNTIRSVWGIYYAGLICYEAIFPGNTNHGQEKPEFIINLTNDAWYGKSAGPYQHAVQARFRAIESGIPLVRSANTGISEIADSTGKVIERVELMKRKILHRKLRLPID